ncbi:MAG: aminotransferase class I/II-fold pyridoxal phosphate-dependent enzyme [Chloroflexi bacterium]|nr:aminotransferase class I/II-fold pyridoxal phosphate-dependent enzyme [Chloroflexota bacterium]
MPIPAARLNQLPTYVFAIIGERIRQLRAQNIDVIRLDIGSPDLPPPDIVVEKLAQSAQQKEHHGYTDYKGTPDFRVAVAEHYKRRFGVELNPETEVLPLLGSKEGIVNLALAYIGPGDLVLVPDIGYPSYSMGARLAGGEVHWVPILPENGFLTDFDSIPLEAAAQAKLLWVNYPNNPTGAVASADYYQRAVDYCRDHDIILASDNPYIDIVYDGGPSLSALQADGAKEWVVEFMSFSKSYNMAGWRLGAAVGSATALKHLLKVKSNMDSGHFKPVYDAGIAALTHTTPEWAAERNRIYQGRRDRVMAALPQIGLRADAPKGSLYIWAEVENGAVAEYVEDALCSAHVALTHGEAYGPGGKRYVRFSLCGKDERLDEALERLKQWYSKK